MIEWDQAEACESLPRLELAVEEGVLRSCASNVDLPVDGSPGSSEKKGRSRSFPKREQVGREEGTLDLLAKSTKGFAFRKELEIINMGHQPRTMRFLFPLEALRPETESRISDQRFDVG